MPIRPIETQVGAKDLTASQVYPYQFCYHVPRHHVAVDLKYEWLQYEYTGRLTIRGELSNTLIFHLPSPATCLRIQGDWLVGGPSAWWSG